MELCSINKFFGLRGSGLEVANEWMTQITAHMTGTNRKNRPTVTFFEYQIHHRFFLSLHLFILSATHVSECPFRRSEAKKFFEFLFFSLFWNLRRVWIEMRRDINLPTTSRRLSNYEKKEKRLLLLVQISSLSLWKHQKKEQTLCKKESFILISSHLTLLPFSLSCSM